LWPEGRFGLAPKSGANKGKGRATAPKIAKTPTKTALARRLRGENRRPKSENLDQKSQESPKFRAKIRKPLIPGRLVPLDANGVPQNPFRTCGHES